MRNGRVLYYSKLTRLPPEAFYMGHHWEDKMDHGIGFIPLGDRERDKPEYGVEMTEERGSDAHIWRI